MPMPYHCHHQNVFPELNTVFLIIITIVIIIIAIISIVPYLTNKGEHTALYKINKNVYINPI